jgi:hypothetical protein
MARREQNMTHDPQPTPGLLRPQPGTRRPGALSWMATPPQPTRGREARGPFASPQGRNFSRSSRPAQLTYWLVPCTNPTARAPFPFCLSCHALGVLGRAQGGAEALPGR